jgi:hypothetical protein
VESNIDSAAGRSSGAVKFCKLSKLMLADNVGLVVLSQHLRA